MLLGFSLDRAIRVLRYFLGYVNKGEKRCATGSADVPSEGATAMTEVTVTCSRTSGVSR